MKKFLGVFDGYKMSKSTMEYAIQLTKAADAHLVGVFLDDFIYRSYSVYKVITTADNYEATMMELDEKGFQVAVGSACSASSDEPSHVLKAIGMSDEDARASLRITMGRHTTEKDLLDLLKTCKGLIA